MRYFIDTEFHEEPHSIQLISIGICREDGEEFYAESLDYRDEDASDWLKGNVIPHLWKNKIGNAAEWRKRPEIAGGLLRRGDIGREILKWVGDDTPEFWGYYADYDWVVFCWLFGSMIDLPKGWPMYCRDIKQWADQLGDVRIPKQATNEHHALADARWNKEAFEYLSREAHDDLVLEVADGAQSLHDMRLTKKTPGNIPFSDISLESSVKSPTTMATVTVPISEIVHAPPNNNAH